MAKKLVFDGGSETLFSNIFNSYHVAARPSSREDHKSNNKILDAFEDISAELENPVPGFAPDDAGAPRARELKSGRQYVILEDHTFDFLTRAISGVTTLACKSREIAAMWEFLDSAQAGGAKALAEEEAVTA